MIYAGLGSRFLAGLIDSIIFSVVSGLINSVVNTSISNEWGIGINFVQLILVIVYFVIYQFYTGQTLGKKVMKIKVVDANGKKPTILTFLLRETIGKTVSIIILLFGYLMIFWDSKRQGLHDKIANTYVVKN